MSTSQVSEVHAILRARNALIVHFSTLSGPLDRPAFKFPQDLRFCINNQVPDLCCSTILPGDSEGAALGDLGVIVVLLAPDSLKAAGSHDVGSSLLTNGRREYKQTPLDPASLDASIVGRRPDDHNEWILNDYIVRGLFVRRTQGIRTAAGPIDLARVRNEFPGIRVYAFQSRDLVEMHPRGAVPASHSEIYR